MLITGLATPQTPNHTVREVEKNIGPIQKRPRLMQKGISRKFITGPSVTRLEAERGNGLPKIPSVQNEMSQLVGISGARLNAVRMENSPRKTLRDCMRSKLGAAFIATVASNRNIMLTTFGRWRAVARTIHQIFNCCAGHAISRRGRAIQSFMPNPLGFCYEPPPAKS